MKVMKLLAQDQAALDLGNDEQVTYEDFVAVLMLTKPRSHQTDGPASPAKR
jgi:hypothetical protein